MSYSFLQLEKEEFVSDFIRDFKAGDVLFQQGQVGKSFFIVLKGKISLFQETELGEHLFARVEANSILGEKSLLEDSPRHRQFSAHAETDVRAIELNVEDLKKILTVKPDLLFEILKRCLEVSTERLDRANYLAKCLRGSDNRERLKRCLIYLSQTIGLKEKEGVFIPGLQSALHYYLGFSNEELGRLLEWAIDEKILTRSVRDEFILVTEKVLG